MLIKQVEMRLKLENGVARLYTHERKVDNMKESGKRVIWFTTKNHKVPCYTNKKIAVQTEQEGDTLWVSCVAGMSVDNSQESDLFRLMNKLYETLNQWTDEQPLLEDMKARMKKILKSPYPSIQ